MSSHLNNPKNKLIDQKIIDDSGANKHENLPNIHTEFHDDYDQIQAAVLETKRGRWFLGEYARKNRQVESQLVLDALTSIQNKIDGKKPDAEISKVKVETQKPTTPKVEAQKTEPPKNNFSTEQQSSLFGKLFVNFKQKTITGLKWAGIKGTLEFSKIQTIINFAAYQSRVSIETQEKKLNAIIAELSAQKADPKIIRKLNTISSELHKLEELQVNLNVQLEDGLKFMGEVEKIAHNPTEYLEEIAQKQQEKDQKTAEKQQKTAEKQQKMAKNEPKIAEIEPETTEIEPEIVEIEPKNIRLGPAGRIKKMFRIEQTLKQQQAANLAEPAKAFDEAFANQRLTIKENPSVISTPENIERDIQPAENNQKISAQSDKLAKIGDVMKQADAGKTNPAQAPEIVIDEDFNALNSLALLSKTERTMLFTLQN